MASSKKVKMMCIVNILSYCLYSLAESQDTNFETTQNNCEVNQSQLQCTSAPELTSLIDNFTDSNCSNSESDTLSLYGFNSENAPYTSENAYDLKARKCSDDLNHFLSNLQTPWALQMLDSDGKLPSGLLRGELIWPGYYSECISAFSPLDEDGHGDFHGRYCVSSWVLKLNAKYSNLPLTVGLCVPDSCSGENVKIALKNASLIIDHVPVLKEWKEHLTLNSIVCKAKEKSLDASSIAYLCVITVFILPTLIGSLLDVFEYWKSNRGTRNRLSNAHETHGNGAVGIHNFVESQPNGTFTKEPPANTAFVASNTEIQGTQQTVPTVKQILLCFSIFSNGRRLLNTREVEGQLLSIHGIKFLSLAWIILGHTGLKALPVIGNKLDVLEKMDTFPFQFALQSHFSVDSFFLLSGFLLTYMFLKVAEERGKINWVIFYLHRIWRLTPSCLTVVFFYMLLFKYLGSGPFWVDHCDSKRGSWWKYLLYINNFIPIRQMCVGWTWYLANDVQFYFISPFILYPLWKSPIFGLTIIGSILFATWTTTGIMCYSYDIVPMFYGAKEAKDFVAYEKKMWESFDLVYDKPYCRIAPYIIGIILGFILHKTAGRKNFLTGWQQLLGSAIALFCSLSVVFGLQYVEMSATAILFYNVFCRSSFSIGLAWLIYVCETGHGGFVAKFLSWKLFVPLGRLSYSAYLLHPMIIVGYYQLHETVFHLTEFVIVTNFLGFLILSFASAFIFSLVCESPFMNLEKFVLRREKHR